MLEIRLAIVEDEPLAAERLRELLAQWKDGTVHVVAQIESVAEGIEVLPTLDLDLLLCDIRLADGLSFNIWQHIDLRCPTIFTTAYEEYALQAFKVNSIDYLLKPIQASELYTALTRFGESRFGESLSRPTLKTAPPVSPTPELIAEVLQAMKGPSHRQRFMSKVGDKLVPVATNDIAFFVSIDRITWAYRFDGSRLPLSETLEQVAQSVDPRNFARLNRAYLAQAKAIEQLTAYSNSRYRAQLSGHTGEPVIVARDRVAELKTWLSGSDIP